MPNIYELNNTSLAQLQAMVLSGGYKVQSGSGSIAITSANVQQTALVTYPATFSTAPIVVIGINSVTNNATVYVNLFAASPGTGGFTLAASSGTAQTVSYNWIAIGS